ncbi:xylulokinase [Halanaerobium sp. ST460_2HS_T2]|uniref:xylulokinase n=1 Tax=Halanaerobium sp. ST460_2HS_T2 TaxID=2183914 RepID=UPI000DF355F9|nr:xylulokinase [Halanaerobium sp. ST460_2HS_T2]RCW49805.1 xylulokinase [Halanaerobium sp. ST460_2HS_T2]
MNKELFMGIDVGTSAVKILVADRQGSIVSSGSSSYKIDKIKDNYAEQNPEIWWQAVKKILSNLDCNLKDVKSIGMSGQLNGIVSIKENGEIVRNAIIWLDQRAEKEVEYLNNNYLDKIKKYTYSKPGTIYSLTKLLWLRNNEEENFKNTYKFLAVKDYISYKLTNNFVTDMSDAGAAQLLNLNKRDWCYEILEEIVDLNKLPELLESPDLAGKVTEKAAEETGFKIGTPVIVGAGDMAALALGTGVVKPNTACATIGTAGHTAAFIEELPKEMDDRLWVMCHAVPNKYFWHGLVMTGGYCLSWFINNFASLEEKNSANSDNSIFDILLNRLSKIEVGSNGIIFLPFLNGEATPGKDSKAKAAFLGIESSSDRLEMARSVLEGVCYNFKESFEIFDEINNLNIKEVMIGEGGSQNSLWPQIMADVLEKEVLSFKELNSSALGAVILAGVGAGYWDTFTDAVDNFCKIKEIKNYDELNSKKYEKYYGLYKLAKNNLKEFNSELQNIRRNLND